MVYIHDYQLVLDVDSRKSYTPFYNLNKQIFSNSIASLSWSEQVTSFVTICLQECPFLFLMILTIWASLIFIYIQYSNHSILLFWLLSLRMFIRDNCIFILGFFEDLTSFLIDLGFLWVIHVHKWKDSLMVELHNCN